VLQIGEDVLIMGYPLGKYYDEAYNLPIVRNGIVASAYPVPYKNNPYFLVEARLHKGTSGAPIVTKFKNIWKTIDGKTITNGFAFYLLGVKAESTRQIGSSNYIETKIWHENEANTKNKTISRSSCDGFKH
jgi:hypothetical protein